TCNGGKTLKKVGGALRLLSCSILNNILGDSRLLSGRTPLPFRALRHRFLWRQRAPISPSEIRRIERWLATARVFLAISALVAVLIDPGEIHYSLWASLFTWDFSPGLAGCFCNTICQCCELRPLTSSHNGSSCVPCIFW